MSSSSFVKQWLRVASGVQKVAHAAASRSGQDLAVALVRTSQHARDVASSAAITIAAVPPTRPSSVTSPLANRARQMDPIRHGGPDARGEAVLSHVDDGTMRRVPQDSVDGRDQTERVDTPTTTTALRQCRENDEPGGNENNDSAEGISLSNASLASLANAGVERRAEESMAHRSDVSEQIASVNQIRTTPAEFEYSRIKEGKAIPSSRVGRALGFANLGLGIAIGTVRESASRIVSGSSLSGSVVVNDRNSDLLAASLCRMRGAALKMGQMLSIQDESLLPPALARALQQVRQGADAMPAHQLHQQMESSLGLQWRDKFVEFDALPFAAASIGQVHRAKILQKGKEKDVVVKVQYPGVAKSIESDLGNLSMLVKLSGLAPKGLFVENVIRVGQNELTMECDYQREKENQKRIQTLVESDPVLREHRIVVPDVVEELTTDQILTSEYFPGGTIDKAAHAVDQKEKNRIGRAILYLTMKELFDWRFMQTDPNWGNFLYDVGSKTTGLIDFGATREYSRSFVDGYLRIVWASANQDAECLMEQSYKMGFLTGDENDAMIRAHQLSGFTVGEPFWKDEPFDFRGSNISERMGEHTSVFLKHRLTPPPEEVYTLHRKLAGAYMLCIKLGAVVRSRDMLENIVANHDFQDGMKNPVTQQSSGP